MISTIAGTIKEIGDHSVILDIGFMGFDLYLPSCRGLKIGKKVQLYTYMHWNSEQGPSLYGFTDQTERAVFLLIISCSGLGPKIGLAILAQLGVQNFLEAIQSGNDQVLSKVNGIGAKKAEQIIVQLKHKVKKLLKSGIEIKGSTALTQWNNVSEVLNSLNYSRAEINAAMKHLTDQKTSNASFDQLMRGALSFLAKKA